MSALVALCLTFFFTPVATAGTYPSSKDAPRHEWETMGSNPFTGMPYEGCQRLGFSAELCTKYLLLRDANSHSGDCNYMDVPNGTVLDQLLFGNGIVLEDVLVNLKTFTTRRSLVCELDGKALISFDGCNNLAVVNHWSFDEVPVRGSVARPYQEPVRSCPLDNARYQLVSVLEASAIEHECSQRLVDVPGEDGLDGERLSRTCGRVLNENYGPGVLNHAMELVFIPYGSEFEYLLFQGAIQHNELTPAAGYEDMIVDNMVRIPDLIHIDEEIVTLDSGRIEIRFGDYGKLLSPRPVHLSERIERLRRAHDPFFPNRCGRTVATAIERLELVE